MKTLALSLLGLAVGGVAHAASPSPRAHGAQVDHLILGIRDLDEGIRRFEERTGVRPMVGGEHPGRGTRNALVSLGNRLYVEILAPQAGAPDSGAAGGLRALADLTPMGWAVSVRDVEDARRRLGDAGFGLSDVMPGSRARPDGTLLEWQTFGIVKPQPTISSGAAVQIAGVPFFIRWGDRTKHPSEDSPGGCALERLRVASPNVDDLRRALAALPLEVELDAAARGRMSVTLRCPKGTVTFGGEAAAR
jgi:hypothetical protein